MADRRSDSHVLEVPGGLRQVLEAAAAGTPPPADGLVVVDRASAGPVAGVLAFTAHHVVAADVPAAEVAPLLPAGDLSAPLGPAFLLALAARLGAPVGAHDLVLAAPALQAPPLLELEPCDDLDFPRLHRARRYRDDVRALCTPGGAGVLLLGRGLAGRWEAAIEVRPDARGRGLGRRLAASARSCVPAPQPVFLQVAAGNVASVRAVLAAGYRPIGAEVLLPLRCACHEFGVAGGPAGATRSRV